MAFAVLRTSKLLQMMRCAQRSSVVCNVLVVALVFVLLFCSSSTRSDASPKNGKCSQAVSDKSRETVQLGGAFSP